jgi:hypothetical protein
VLTGSIAHLMENEISQCSGDWSEREDILTSFWKVKNDYIENLP